MPVQYAWDERMASELESVDGHSYPHGLLTQLSVLSLLFHISPTSVHMTIVSFLGYLGTA